MARAMFSRHHLLLVIALAGVVQMLALAIRPDSVASHNFWAALGSGKMPPKLQGWEKVDAALKQSFADRTQNIMADFRGTRLGDDLNGQLRSLVITRATYQMWPKRFYFGDPSVARVWENEVANATLPTDPAWPAAHDVTTRAHITLGPALEPLTIEVEPVSRP